MPCVSVVVGLLIAAVGTAWALQGLNILGGSVMSGQTIFAMLGPIVALAGLALVTISLACRHVPNA